MFLGHYGLALAAKRVAPRASLGTLVFSAQLLDELWPLLLLTGIEQMRIVPGLMSASSIDFVWYPWSHSLLIGGRVGRRRWSALPRAHAQHTRCVGGGSSGAQPLDSGRSHAPAGPASLARRFDTGGGWALELEAPHHPHRRGPLRLRSAHLSPNDPLARCDRPLGTLGHERAAALHLLQQPIRSSPTAERTLAWSALLLWLFVPWSCGWTDTATSSRAAPWRIAGYLDPDRRRSGPLRGPLRGPPRGGRLSGKAMSRPASWPPDSSLDARRLSGSSSCPRSARHRAA